MFLEGRRQDLMKSIEERMLAAAEGERFEEAAAYRDLLRTLDDIEERHDRRPGRRYRCPCRSRGASSRRRESLHPRAGRVVDCCEFYWEELAEFDPHEFVPSCSSCIWKPNTFQK